MASGAGLLAVRGIRDVVSGLVILAILAIGNRRVLGWVMPAMALTPFGDMIIVLPRPPSACTAPPQPRSSSPAASCSAVPDRSPPRLWQPPQVPRGSSAVRLDSGGIRAWRPPQASTG
ncbi:DUF4267 domain-containing protein [Nonomuraea sp. GTA35]|uniref:DUF4267 domain-containing protein n=1 Tax=Nonomuraea sp. GTA35 TaxID=1676746 RepID=UPI0035C05790